MKVIETYLPDQFNEIPSKRLMDFVTVNPRSNLEMSILDTWKWHFEKARVPFAIEEKINPDWGNTLILWKERRV